MLAELRDRLDGAFAYIRPEYADVTYDESDLAGIAVADIKKTSDNASYFITPERQGSKEVIDAVMKMYSLGFVDHVIPNNVVEGT